MINPSLRTRIFLSYFLLIALAAILLNWLFGNRIAALADDAFFDSFEQKVEIVIGSLEDIASDIPPQPPTLGERLLTESELTESELTELELTELEDVMEGSQGEGESAFTPLYTELEKLVATQNVHIMLIHADEELVLYDSQSSDVPYLMEDWEEVWAVIEQEEAVNLEYDNLQSIYYADTLFYENVLYDDQNEEDDRNDESLVIRVGESWQGMAGNIWRQRMMLAAGTFLGGLVLLFAIGGWMANTLTQPLTALRSTVQEMATGNLGVRSDTTAPAEIQQLAVDFNQMAAVVEAMMAEQKAFASNAAHELRTPLTAIRIRTEALLEDEPDEALLQQYIHEIDDESNRLTRLIEDLRFLSQADSRNLAVGTEQIDVGKVIEAVRQELAPQIQNKNLDLTLMLPSEPVLLRISMAQFRVVMRNLIENAVKYTPDSGKIYVTLEQNEDSIHVTVADTGIGIDAEDLPNLFTRFYRVEKSRNRKIPGTGLGLSLVQSIMELYGGTIEVTSDGVGHGTIAILILPQRRFDTYE